VPQGRYDKLDTDFMGARTPKIWDGRKRPKFGAIANNFGLPGIYKRKMALSTAVWPTFGEQKIGERWFTNNKVCVANVYRPKSTVHFGQL